MNKLIVCEGLDGSGKTTTINEAMKRLDCCVYNKGLCSDTWSGRISRIFPCTLTLMLDLIYQTYFIILPNLLRGRTVFQDRYSISVLSHPAMQKWWNKLLAALLLPLLVKPAVLIYFTVSKKERIRRLKSLPYNKYHEELIKNPAIITEREKRFKEFYEKFDGKKIKIDTTKINANRCAALLTREVAYTAHLA